MQGANQPSLSLWLDLLKNIIGPVIGAGFVLLGIWLKELYERRKGAQQWYEQEYITDGVDQLITFALATQRRLISAASQLGLGLSDPDKEYLTTEVLSKLHTLLGFRKIILTYDLLLRDVNSYANNPAAPGMSARREKALREFIDLSDKLIQGLFNLRKELLRIKVRRKSDVHSIATKPSILSLLHTLDEAVSTSMNKLQNISLEKIPLEK